MIFIRAVSALACLFARLLACLLAVSRRTSCFRDERSGCPRRGGGGGGGGEEETTVKIIIDDREPGIEDVARVAVREIF